MLSAKSSKPGHRVSRLACTVFFLIAMALPVTAQEDVQTDTGSERVRRFGGPDQVENQITEDETSVSRVVEKRLVEPYFEWKKSLQEKYGLSFGVDYSAVYLKASDSPAGAEDRASSGIARFFGAWDLIGRKSGNTGAFVWKVEHRHKYTDIPPNPSDSI